MGIHSLFWLATLFSSAGMCIFATASDQLQRDPLFLFNSPTHQYQHESKAHIPHDERLYSLWTQQFDFNDKEGIEKLSTELKDIKAQLLSQARHISSLREFAELDSRRSKYYPFQDTRWKLESRLHSARFERDANERERKQISLRKSIEELEAQEQQLSHKLNQFQEEEDDIMATAHEIGKTILAINYPDLWLSYFENARSVRQMYENEGGVGKDEWYGEANCILAEDFGGPSFEPIGPRFIELGDSVSGDSREGAGTNPHLPKQ